jgi:hypothetical protein
MSSALTPASVTSTENLWRVVWKLLRLRIVIFVSAFRRAKLRAKILTVVGVLLVLVFLGVIFFVSWTLLRFFRSPELASLIGDTRGVMESVPALIVSGTFIGILITSFGVLLQALPGWRYGLSAQRTGTHPRRLHIQIAASHPAQLRVGLFVRSARAVWAGYLSGIFHPFLSVGPAGPFRIGARCSRRRQFVGDAGGAHLPCPPYRRSIGLHRCNLIFYLLAIWAAGALWRGWSRTGSAGVENGRTREQPLVAISLGGAWSGEHWGIQLAGWNRSYFAHFTGLWGDLQRSACHIRASVLHRLGKYFLVMRRDMRNMSQLVMPLILGIIYFIMLIRNGSEISTGRGEAPPVVLEILRNASTYTSVGLALFVGWMLLGRLAGMGFAQEGKSYWLIKAAPVSSTRQIIAKFLVAYLPTLVLCFAFVLLTWAIHQTGLLTLLFTLPALTLCIAGNTGIYLSFGIAGANMNWEDPRHMQKGIASCLGTLVNTIYLPISMLFFFGPPVGATLLDLPEIAGQLVGLLLGGVFSLACATIPLVLVYKRVARLAEN